MSQGTSRTMKKGVRSGVVAVVAAVIVTAVGFTVVADPGTAVEAGSLIYMGWVSALTFLGCLVVAKYYSSIPDRTPVHKLFWTSLLVGVPAFASGLFLPATSPFTGLATPVFVVGGGIVTMWVFLYVFDWKDSSNPFFSAGEAPR